MIKNGECYLVY